MELYPLLTLRGVATHLLRPLGAQGLTANPRFVCGKPAPTFHLLDLACGVIKLLMLLKVAFYKFVPNFYWAMFPPFLAVGLQTVAVPLLLFMARLLRCLLHSNHSKTLLSLEEVAMSGPSLEIAVAFFKTTRETVPM